MADSLRLPCTPLAETTNGRCGMTEGSKSKRRKEKRLKEGNLILEKRQRGPSSQMRGGGEHGWTQQQGVRSAVSGSSGTRAFKCSAEQDRRPAAAHGGWLSEAVGEGRSQPERKKNCPRTGRL